MTAPGSGRRGEATLVPFAEWREAGARLVPENFAAFRALVSEARRLAAAGRHDEAAAEATRAAYRAQRRHPGLFRSQELEDCLMAIGRATVAPGRPRPRPDRIGRVLHVGTNMSVMSGNPKLIRRWIRLDTGRVSTLALTKQAPHQVPAPLREAVAASGGRIHALNAGPGGFVARARRLRRLAGQSDVIVHHGWENDVVPTLAFADGEGLPPVLYVNHGDHWFWMGACFADAVVSLRESGMRFTAERRGVEARRNLLLPTPLEPLRRTMERAEAKRRLGIEPDRVLLLSIAGAAKFRTVDGANFAEVHLPVLRAEPRAALIVIGPHGLEDWSAAVGESGGRIRVLPETFETAVFYQAADVYVDSFPFTSITSLLEAGSYGVALVSRSPFPERAAILGSDAPGLDGNLPTATTREEYVRILSRLVADDGARAELGARTQARIESLHHGEGWRRRLEEVYAGALALPPPGRPSAPAADTMTIDDADAYLPVIHGRTWHSEWIDRYVVNSVPLAARWRCWRAAARAGHRDATPMRYLLPEWLSARWIWLRQFVERQSRRLVRRRGAAAPR
jgi:hypothetical protein